MIAIVVSDSKLGEVLATGFRTKLPHVPLLTPEEWRQNGKPPVGWVFFCQEACFNEPRRALDSVAALEDQWLRLFDTEVKQAVQLTLELLPQLKQASQTSNRPSSLVFLGSKLVRSPNSPNQVVSSMVKKAVQIFCGSMFFEHRADGLRFTTIHPGPGVSHATTVNSMLFSGVECAPTACIESIDLAKIIVPRLIPQKSRGCAVVTGASRGIGKCIAVRLAKEFKLPVVLLGRDELALQSTMEECAKHVGRALVRTVSLELGSQSDPELQACITRAGNEFGHIQTLVCSAGYNRRATAAARKPDGTLRFASPTVWKEMMEVNYGSAVSATAFALPFMVEQPNGPAIFYIGSRTVRLGNSPGQQSYVATKMAIAGFAASVQHEVKEFGVRVVCLNVGLVSTELGTKAPKKATFVPVAAEKQIQPEDIADAVSFTLRTEPGVSPQTFDICGMSEEFLDAKSGGALKMSSL
ncbi:hypothetical protein BASA81_009817 [Batrachochytrium salamandrivorans]|nr:hypothetical protein BASA81_009817 [Batrachochytrium salamandrivorans]